tara:strand:- start:2718 stop:3566 length:849 start_codon:yes stop_codon:yes gene_type:complete
MSQHNEIMRKYQNGDVPIYPVDSVIESMTNDPWEWQPGYDKKIPTPRDEVMWAETVQSEIEVPMAKRIEKYKENYVKKYGRNSQPFVESTMMIAPVEWSLGYDDVTNDKLVQLGQKQGEGEKIINAIGVLNSQIEKLEGLLYEAQASLRYKRGLLNNYEYMEALRMYEPTRISIIESDTATTQTMVENYEAEVNRLRADGAVLNEELKAVLSEYQTLTGELKVGGDESFVQEARGIVGPTITHLTAAALGMGLLYVLARNTRRRRPVRADRRGADGLFFNFG